MSASQLQLGIALVLRSAGDEPSLTRKLAALKLTSTERARLNAIASDPDVRRFGESMAGWRTREALAATTYTTALLGEKRARALCQAWLGKLAECDDRALPLAVLDRITRTKRLPTAVRAVAAYEKEIVALLAGDPLALPKSSRLAHGDFRIVDSSYDVPAFARGVEMNRVRPPKRRRVTALLLADETEGFRVFEIDAELRAFLKGELGLGPRRKVLPPAYSDLVAVGLCR